MHAIVKTFVAMVIAVGFAGAAQAMMPASTKGGGTSINPGPLDVSKVPAGPAPPVPIPYPNTGKRDTPMPPLRAPKVQIENKPAQLKNSSTFKKSTGDEAGATGKGIVSGVHKGKVDATQVAPPNVKFKGKVLLTPLGSMSEHNGKNANAPPGQQLAPSQTKVLTQ